MDNTKWRPCRSTRDVTGGMTVKLEETGRQPYADSLLSAGLVHGHPADTIYLQFERLAGDEEPTTILVRADEALAILWLLSGALWSQRVSQD